jgi:putative ATP-binding cassette transporter
MNGPRTRTPEFRSLFYRDLLPELKREGKTLIVVSHDDRYFGVADLIVRMSAGRIVEEVISPGKRKSSVPCETDSR